ncbi:MAG: DNA methylase N-4, partial [Burkholderia sp.]|nr:DNA methylase N-4 [Burkholderia sp.]
MLNYAGFLGIADKSALKTKYFNRDPKKADDLVLRENMREEFWLWIYSWAAFLQRPSDLGYDDTGYDLPPLEIVYHEIPSDHLTNAQIEGTGQLRLLKDAAGGVSPAAAEKRDSLGARVAKLMEIIEAADPSEHFILWHDQEKEREAIQAALPDAVSVWGTQDLEEREKRIIGFSNGEYRFLSTKPVIAGSGCNFQRHCHRAIFVGIGYKFNDFIQAIHRIRRFQQTHQCRIDIIYTEAERGILETLQSKWRKHDETVAEMSALIQEFGLRSASITQRLQRRIHEGRTEYKGKRYTVVSGDTIPATAAMPADSVDAIITSIPFGNLYEYSLSY